MSIWTAATNNNTADELVTELLKKNRAIKGCRPNKISMLESLSGTINSLMTKSVIISVLLCLFGQCVPLIGSADAKGFIIHSVIVLDIKNQLKKLQLQKSGKYIFYIHNIL